MNASHERIIREMNGSLPKEHRLSETEIEGLKSEEYFKAYTAITLKGISRTVGKMELIAADHETRLARLATHKNLQWAVVIIILGLLLHGH